MSALTLPAEAIAAICEHMNGDHGADSLLIVRALGAYPQASSARMVGVDGDGADFVVRVDDDDIAVRLPWRMEVTERKHVRQAVVQLYSEARAILGEPDEATAEAH